MFSRKWLGCALFCLLLPASFELQAQPGAIDTSLLPDVIRVCADENGFPPFTFVRDNTSHPAGFNIELINRILAPIGKRADYQMMPWRRCLAMAASGDVDVLLDVQDTPERHRTLLMPTSHYGTRPVMIALESSKHVMQMITSKSRMLALDICRLSGWDISRLASSAELEPAGEPDNLAAAINMLRQGRCDILIYTAELFSGGLHTRAISPDNFEGITFHLMPWETESIPKFFGISRNMPAAQTLRDLFDWHIKQMHASGELSELLTAYLPASD